MALGIPYRVNSKAQGLSCVWLSQPSRIVLETASVQPGRLSQNSGMLIGELFERALQAHASKMIVPEPVPSRKSYASPEPVWCEYSVDPNFLRTQGYSD